MPHQTPTTKGFTLLETLLSIALMALIAAIGIPLTQSFQVRNDLNIAATTIANTARRAEALARASDGDTSWGVHTALGAITLFRGASYAARDASYDETFDLPASITPSGTAEYVFARRTGYPTASGATTLTSSIGETRTLIVNGKGMVDY